MPQGQIVITLVNDKASRTRSKAGGSKKTELSGQEEDESKSIFELWKEEEAKTTFQSRETAQLALKSFAAKELTEFGINTLKTGISFATQNIGNWTGDLSAVREIQAASNVFNLGASAISNVVSGVVGGSLFGPAGMIIGGAIGAVKSAIDVGTQAYNYNVGVIGDNRSVLFYKQRAGQELTNWSR